ncbi:MAG: sulfatase-like hydrolase/transferase [Candidatus Sumerlaeota bacterium]|nr:sulfatase-like hydrolase/transferase [Candidatus Sumerlaeota bacterium]
MNNPDMKAAPAIAKAVTRRQLLKAGVAGLGAAAAPRAFGAPAAAAPRKPNLLFINVDQMSYDANSAFGPCGAKTPNIERLARRGVLFTESYSADPVCCPARAAWMTGRMSSENGVVMNELPILPDLPDMGQWLREKAGYESVHVGKWHVPARDVAKSFKMLHGGFSLGQHGDLATARACEAYLRQRRGSDPFFLVAGLLNPHDICYWGFMHYTTKEDVGALGIADRLPPLPPNFDKIPTEPERLRKLRQAGPNALGPGQWTEEQWRYYIYAYDRYVEMVDGAVGRILDALEDSGQADNTIVILTADHGESRGRHRFIFKSKLYEEAVKVPMIVSCPGRLPEGVRDIKRLVSGLDLAPTWCDYAGIEPPAHQRGRSLRPALEGNATEWRDFVPAQSGIDGRTIRTGQYKYVMYKGDPVEQLFDLKNDPWETKNLAGDAQFDSVLADHRELQEQWEASLIPAPVPEGGWMELLKKVKPQKRQPAPKSKG